jgi:hypothetical protein
MVVNHFLSGMILQGTKGISSFRLDGYTDICVSYGMSMKTLSGNWDLEGVYIYTYIQIYKYIYIICVCNYIYISVDP